MAPLDVVFVCSTGAGQHRRASAHCGIHNRTADAACGHCGEHLWDGDHRCR